MLDLTSTLTIWFNYRVGVVHCTVEEIEDVSTDDGCQSHEAPVDGEAIGTKRIDDERWEDTKKNAICESGESGHGPQEVGILNANGSNLSQSKDGGRDGSAPKA
ncbi:hypothetical protein J4E89_007331 [Alternaria sp. Ai002NY15]|nr:hypothetical protein J4E89_007331 [Alternaria sp. Ai002NY15]